MPRPVLDRQGQTMFRCAACGLPLTEDDFFDLGLRLPEPGESRSEYCENELIDVLHHADCLRAKRAG